MEKRPNVVKKETKMLPISFAWSMMSCLMGTSSSPWPATLGSSS